MKFLEGKKTILSTIFTLLASMAGMFAPELSVDWVGLNAAVLVVIGSVSTIISYFATKRGAAE